MLYPWNGEGISNDLFYISFSYISCSHGGQSTLNPQHMWLLSWWTQRQTHLLLSSTLTRVSTK